jgi:hypothetical protein
MRCGICDKKLDEPELYMRVGLCCISKLEKLYSVESTAKPTNKPLNFNCPPLCPVCHTCHEGMCEDAKREKKDE